jgi:hypothetical protein
MSAHSMPRPVTEAAKKLHLAALATEQFQTRCSVQISDVLDVLDELRALRERNSGLLSELQRPLFEVA